MADVINVDREAMAYDRGKADGFNDAISVMNLHVTHALVPREPTSEMVAKGGRAVGGELGGSWRTIDAAVACYRAMIAAAAAFPEKK